MNWHNIAFAVAAAIAAPLAAFTTLAAAEDAPRLTGPAVHENLAVYFIHGKSAAGPVPLTLREAMSAGQVTVHETGNVNMLSIENTGNTEVFVQAGDIVKGGQQDRVLTISLLLPASSGRVDISAYCVEQGRWSARGKEDVKKFASAEKALPSRDAKLAMLAPVKPRTADPATSANTAMLTGLQTTGMPARPTAGLPARITAGMPARTLDTAQQVRPSDTGSRQSEMWSSVAKAQRKLTDNLGAPVTSAASASSLQLSLENERLVNARRGYLAALELAAGAGDIVGYVFAIGGKLNSGDVYASHELFKKMWAKQLEAAVTEAIAEKNTSSATAAPGVDEVREFMAGAEAGKAEEAQIASNVLVRETRDSDKALLTETRHSSGAMVHRVYIAR